MGKPKKAEPFGETLGRKPVVPARGKTADADDPENRRLSRKQSHPSCWAPNLRRNGATQDDELGGHDNVSCLPHHAMAPQNQ